MAFEDTYRSLRVKGKFSMGMSGHWHTLGGDVTENIPVQGTAVGDTVLVTMNTVGASPVTVTTAVAGVNEIVVTLSANPSTDHILNYMVLKA